MVTFPNCKVNLGLRVLRKRPDGYHDIETVMVPAPWCDVLEIVPSLSRETTLTISGRKVDCPVEKNLVMRAYRAVESVVPLPPVDIFLRKVIPDGAGLGGGSADAAFTIRTLNDMFALGLSDQKLAEIASTIGADCPFFIYNRPMLATGTGTDLTPVDMKSIEGLTMLIAKPDVSVSTKEAYSNITPSIPDNDLLLSLAKPVATWSEAGVHNDFEDSIFPLHPEIKKVKEIMSECGAMYCSMTGSGAAVVGLFATDKMAEEAKDAINGCDTFIGSTSLK